MSLASSFLDSMHVDRFPSRPRFPLRPLNTQNADALPSIWSSERNQVTGGETHNLARPSSVPNQQQACALIEGNQLRPNRHIEIRR